MNKNMFLKQVVFLVLAGLVLTSPAFIIVSSRTAQDYWNFYEKYITDFKFLDPYLKENVEILGEANSGYTFYVHSGFVQAYYDESVNLSYWYLNPSGALFYSEHLPVITFKFRFVKEYFQSSTYPKPVYPILALTHLHNYNDMLLLLATVSPAETTAGNDQINFFWWRIYYDPMKMETRIENLSISEGSYTYIFLNGRTVFSTDIQISIIPAIYSEKIDNTTYSALFGFYTMINIPSQNISSGFATAWKTLNFTAENITSFNSWLEKFNGWWVFLGTGYFARTDNIAIKFVQPSNFITSSDYVEIIYKSVGVYDAKLDNNRYYSDLVSGLLPEYNQTEIINLANQNVYTFNVNSLAPLLLYTATSIIPAAILRRRQYLFGATAFSIVLTGALFYILYYDLSFIVLSSMLLLFLWKFHSGGWY